MLLFFLFFSLSSTSTGPATSSRRSQRKRQAHRPTGWAAHSNSLRHGASLRLRETPQGATRLVTPALYPRNKPCVERPTTSPPSLLPLRSCLPSSSSGLLSRLAQHRQVEGLNGSVMPEGPPARPHTLTYCVMGRPSGSAKRPKAPRASSFRLNARETNHA